MKVEISNRSAFVLNNAYKNILLNTIRESIRLEKQQNNIEVSISIVTNEEIKKLNSQYRGIEKETDVLSFPSGYSEINTKILKGNRYTRRRFKANPLGDIVISIEKAQSQAQEYGHSLAREIAFLTAHSMLHLLGYDHETLEGEKIMFEKQEKILNELGYFR